MLFKYKKIQHPIDKFHFYIRHLVLEVWCNAKQPFETSLLYRDFEILVNAMPPNFLREPIKEIYDELKKKPKSFKRLLHDGFRKNNNIEALCNGTILPLQYSALKTLDKSFANKLYKFFVNAYDRLDDIRVNASIEGIDNHYKIFFANRNNTAVCPFCGISSMLNPQNTKREAYDHFFPKETYPFNSVNFENLVPMCHTCNSKYKTRKDPINIKYGGLRKNTIYPFSSETLSDTTVDFNFTTNDVQNLTSAQITVQLNTANPADKILRWKEIFGIEERYKAICCEEAAYKGWLEEYQTTKKISGISFTDYIQTKIVNPYLNKKFLEVAYLNACFNNGVIT